MTERPYDSVRMTERPMTERPMTQCPDTVVKNLRLFDTKGVPQV